MASKINFVDLYAFYDELDGSILENLMEDYHISCSIRILRGTPQSPNPAGSGATHGNRDATYDNCGTMMIAVEKESIENARQIIAEAIRNGVISKEGRFGG